MDGWIVAAVAAELGALAGAFVDQIYRPDERTLLLVLRARGRVDWLLSIHPQYARAHALGRSFRPEVPTAPTGFCALLRRHLRGGRLAEVVQPNFDRVLQIRIARGDGDRWLVHEPMGRHSNLALLDAAGVVLGAMKVVAPEQSRVRRLVPGERYTPPPGERIDPRLLTESEFRAEFGEGPLTPAALVGRLAGFGPLTAQEVLARAESGEAAAVWAALRDLVERARQGRFEPVILRDARGVAVGAWPFPLRHWPAERQTRAATISLALAASLHRAEVEGERERRRQQLRQRLERQLAAVQAQLAEARRQCQARTEAESLRIAGELLVAAPDFGRGAREVLLPNCYDPDGAPMRIALDPLLTGRENAAAYFRRYRRAIAAAKAAEARLPRLEAEIARLAHDLARLDAEPDFVPPPGADRPILGPTPTAPPRDPPGIRIRRVEIDGWEVLVGENAASNDYLITHLARPDDLWLHARAVAGAHVIVRGVGRLDRLPPTVLRTAAHLAATHSDAGHAAVVLVDYTLRRYVRKPRGAAPGEVRYEREKTLRVDLR